MIVPDAGVVGGGCAAAGEGVWEVEGVGQCSRLFFFSLALFGRVRLEDVDSLVYYCCGDICRTRGYVLTYLLKIS